MEPDKERYEFRIQIIDHQSGKNKDFPMCRKRGDSITFHFDEMNGGFFRTLAYVIYKLLTRNGLIKIE